VYEELIPSGFARLRMIRSHTAVEEEGESGAEVGSADTIFSGIAMDVNFKSKSGDPMPLSHLSGGERSLLALTLIFAIQRCDPAPFYLFDEVDANLDPAHCVAVARMIQRLAHPSPSEEKEVQVVDGEEIVVERSTTQFIATSFRQEVVGFFGKIYRTVYSNLVSSIGCVDADAALELLHEAAKQQSE
jgi:structural maintenance of chromosome 3 (chondroitin sulfate proteoglycan 6)